MSGRRFPRAPRAAWCLVLALLAACSTEGPAFVPASLDEPAMALPEGAGGGDMGWLASPLASPRVTSYVSRRRGGGWARHDCAVLSRANHRGTDFGVSRGTPVRAASAGTVVASVTGCSNSGSMSSTCGGGFGNHVILAHAGGFATLYAHFSPGGGQVRVGATVECGQVIGTSGNSGRSSGDHLHFEVRSGATDEASYYSARTVDPYGGACSTQATSLWIGGSPGNSCAPAAPRDDAAIVRSTYPTEVAGAAGARLTQTFSVRNTGTTTWTADSYAMVHVSGAFSETASIELPAGARVEPGAAVDLRVNFTVPSAAGLHRGAWRMARTGAAIFGAQGLLAVRVSATPRGCRSAALGREFPSGACAQTEQAGCGVTRCAWFLCSDGAWLCSDGESCPGTRVPNAACAAAPVPGGDAGRSDGGPRSDAGMACGGRGASCGSTAECCAELQCGTGTGAGACCAPEGVVCSRSSECCGGAPCASGYCGCVPANQGCSADSECCAGTLCIVGACRPAMGCGLEQAACASGTDCCSPLGCQSSRGVGAKQCCVSGGNRCENAGDCCGDMLCTAGRCAHRARGESCSNLLDCGGSLLCRGGVCAP